MTNRRPLLRRLKLRHVLLVVLLLSGIIPLALSTMLLIPQSQQVLRDAERDNLVRRAGTLSRDVDSYLGGFREQIAQLGTGVLLPPGSPVVAERLREPWVGSYLQAFWLNQQGKPDDRTNQSAGLELLRVLDLDGAGPTLARGTPSPQAVAALKTAFEQALAKKTRAYQFVDMGPDGVPLVALAVPVAPTSDAAAGPQLVVEALLRFRPLEVLQGEAGQGVGVFLFARAGKLLWWDGGNARVKDGLLKSEALQSFLAVPGSLTQEYKLPAEGGAQEVLAQVSAVEESGWVLIVQKPLATAFAAVDRMLFNILVSTVLLVAVALSAAFLAARWVSRPIQRLTETTHEIAAGKFGRVDTQGLSFEFADLAEDFNRMSGYIESYVRRLQQAAQANRDLFIGSLRAFVAAIDAKDPYTRGHSERVAAMSRVIAKYVGLPEDQQHKIWIGALLHDVGKIGVEDQVLRKAGKLSDEEFDQMKAHTVIGAEIMTAIEQLKDMIPAIRSHHEAWNGRGYPDGLKGEQIPLYARIVGVADTFDAITTNRPYQKAYSLQFAVETITRLTGSRFDAKIVTAFLRAFEAGDIRAAAESVGGRFEEEDVQMPARAAGPR
jgi:putative nucleotidyltransferase with HDIG domain